MRLPKYKIYATLLDAYNGYVNSDEVWDKYWGFSENPPHTPEEFHEQQGIDLIKRINREPFESYDADRGTIFNELVDAGIENRMPCEDIKLARKEIKGELMYEIEYKGQPDLFYINVDLVRRFVKFYKGMNAYPQIKCSGILPTQYGDVELYGYIDELCDFSVRDIKTTKKYNAFKFRDHYQHLVYPYCLHQEGIEIKAFAYDITDFVDVYEELYIYDAERDTKRLREACEGLIEFLEAHRDEITDKKIFGQDVDR